jgi:hypothetical protein
MKEPVVSVKKTFSGDKARAISVRSIAEARLKMMQAQMQRSGIKQAWQHQIDLPTGETISITASFNQGHIHIHAPQGGVKVNEKEWECLCNCNYAVGIVTDKYKNNENDPYYVFNVTACNREKRYIPYQNVLGCDFTPWEIGMPVILLAYNDFLFDCSNLNFNATGCIPIVDEVETPHSEDWRPTYRVAQFCGLSLPKWLEAPNARA